LDAAMHFERNTRANDFFVVHLSIICSTPDPKRAGPSRRVREHAFAAYSLGDR
jgi:hypothetical protein